MKVLIASSDGHYDPLLQPHLLHQLCLLDVFRIVFNPIILWEMLCEPSWFFNTVPASSKRMFKRAVVPWSIAMIVRRFDMARLLRLSLCSGHRVAITPIRFTYCLHSRCFKSEKTSRGCIGDLFTITSINLIMNMIDQRILYFLSSK